YRPTCPLAGYAMAEPCFTPPKRAECPSVDIWCRPSPPMRTRGTRRFYRATSGRQAPPRRPPPLLHPPRAFGGLWEPDMLRIAFDGKQADNRPPSPLSAALP